MPRSAQFSIGLIWLPAVIVGCSPIANLRPASGLMPGKKLELGGGVAALGPRPFVSEDWESSGQIWVTGNASPKITLSGITAFDTDALAAGAALRLNALSEDRVAGGIEGELGYAWAAVSRPFALRVFDQSFVYTAPRLGTWSTGPIFGMPLGVSLRVYEGFMIRAEAQISWQDFKYYNRRAHLAAGVAYQF
jgi:hypothetical protein